MKKWLSMILIISMAFGCLTLHVAAEGDWKIELQNEAASADEGTNHEGEKEDMNGFVAEVSAESASAGEIVTVSLHPATFASGYWNVTVTVKGTSGAEVAGNTYGFTDGQNAYVAYELDFTMLAEDVIVLVKKEATDEEHVVSNAPVYAITLDASQAMTTDPGVDFRGNDVQVNGIQAVLSRETAAEDQTVDITLAPMHAMGGNYLLTASVTREDEEEPFYTASCVFAEGSNGYSSQTMSFVMPAAPVHIVVTKQLIEKEEAEAEETVSESAESPFQVEIINQVGQSESDDDNFDVEWNENVLPGNKTTISVRPTLHVVKNWNVRIVASAGDEILTDQSFGFVDGNNHYIIYSASFQMPEKDVTVTVTKEETSLEELAPMGATYAFTFDAASNAQETEEATSYGGTPVQANGFRYEADLEEAVCGQTVSVSVSPMSFINKDFDVTVIVKGTESGQTFMKTSLNYSRGNNAYNGKTVRFPMPEEPVEILVMKTVR